MPSPSTEIEPLAMVLSWGTATLPEQQFLLFASQLQTSAPQVRCFAPAAAATGTPINCDLQPCSQVDSVMYAPLVPASNRSDIQQQYHHNITVNGLFSAPAQDFYFPVAFCA